MGVPHNKPATNNKESPGKKNPKNKPVSAHINFGEFNVCISDVLLERNKYITMVKTLLSVFHIKIPTITELSFDDHSNIECTTNVYPVSLFYFSIAFNRMYLILSLVVSGNSFVLFKLKVF